MLPADPVLGHPEQEVVARLWRRRRTARGWVYLVGLPSYRDLDDGGVEAAEYRVWVRAPEHVRPVDGVNYDQVPTNPGDTAVHAARVRPGTHADDERLRPHHRHLTRRTQEAASMVTGTSSGTVPSLPLDLAVTLRRTGSFA